MDYQILCTSQNINNLRVITNKFIAHVMQYGKELLQFLAELSENNNKEWFETNRNRYQDLRNSFTATMENLHPLLMKFDKDLETVNPKGTMFRINRDIRFSKDKSPYKNNFGSYFALGGSQSELAGYYIHIQPKNCFVGGGIYMPQPDVLKKIRQEIDYNSEEFLEIINETNFKKYFGTVQGEKLKNTPKDYEKTHPMSEYLKLYCERTVLPKNTISYLWLKKVNP